MSKDLCESGYGFESKEYKYYKPYAEPVKGYDREEYVTYEDEYHMRIVDCRMCDVRLTGCIAPDYPRYFCHREDNRSRQTTLGDF